MASSVLYDLLDADDLEQFTDSVGESKDVNSLGKDGMTVLMYALAHDRENFVNAIMKCKPNLAVKMENGKQALHIAFGNE